ncbi:MAG TPA: xanthine dehydrogenase family protein subunit M [Myxococcales bacterium]|jgi:xanthine dehydrogenase YagS FAD-binding subunit|nr:xanthine dehydrogenase family protein subunit M [Myxococcales bacterium]
MRPFAYERAASVETAVKARGQFIAGGTNLLDLMKADVQTPGRLVDITRLPLKQIAERPDGGLRLGALLTNAATARDERIRSRYPLLAKAILAGASPQLRNLATNGGNLLQRTRCYYFYDTATPCNKRLAGSGCGALHGLNRIHAILGASEQCVAVHPSDMCVALAALNATVNVEGPGGERAIPFADFHRLPGETPQLDNNLQEHELITSIDLPPDDFSAHSSYIKTRDRNSYAFALVSAAAALQLANGKIVQARLALGGVAHKPWRDLDVEHGLKGKAPSREKFREAADAILKDAKPLQHNSFKLELAKRVIVRALENAAEGI